MAFWKFTALRVGLMAALFVVFLYLHLGVIFSAIAAAVIAWCITYLFFRSWRDAAAAAVASRFSGRGRPLRTSTEISDALAEDALTEQDGARSAQPDRRQQPGA
ncbi:DUF4229 domain-containing protein [Arthrobacter mobilis]|uniref:DUF4229 domain-containing protein n=1 Tax=Arthrobacter mobilis TaxID=2724944 RepID=UPI0028ABC411|nr:DUF4229 domain-containing protein [Arthrobacter mobilis]